MSVRYLTKNSIETLFGWETITSPSERLFLKTWYGRFQERLQPQSQIGRYRADFEHVPSKTIIEIDGQEHYLDLVTVLKDRERQKFIESLGFEVIRFPSWLVFKCAEQCTEVAHQLISMRGKAETRVKGQQFHAKDVVIHRIFGEGVILKSDMEQSTEFVTVKFRCGIKRLSMDFAILEKR